MIPRYEYFIGALTIFIAMTVFNILNYWQVYHVKPEVIPLGWYSLWTGPIQIIAYFILVLGIAWTYRGAGEAIWMAVFTLALSSSISKILPVYMISGKAPTHGELIGIILIILSVIVGAVWK
jgi:hypothetical protein